MPEVAEVVARLLDRVYGAYGLRYCPATDEWRLRHGEKWRSGVRPIRGLIRETIHELNTKSMAEAARIAHLGPAEQRDGAVAEVTKRKAFAADPKLVNAVLRRTMRALKRVDQIQERETP